MHGILLRASSAVLPVCVVPAQGTVVVLPLPGVFTDALGATQGSPGDPRAPVLHIELYAAYSGATPLAAMQLTGVQGGGSSGSEREAPQAATDASGMQHVRRQERREEGEACGAAVAPPAALQAGHVGVAVVARAAWWRLQAACRAPAAMRAADQQLCE